MPRESIVLFLLGIIDLAIVIAICLRARVARLDSPLKLALAGAIVVAILAAVSGEDASLVMLGIFHGVILCGGAWAVSRRTRPRVPRASGPDAPVDRLDVGAFAANLLWFCGGAIGGVVASAGLYVLLLMAGMFIKGSGIG